VLTGGYIPSSKLILRLLGQWEVRMLALDLLKMLANLWYSGGILKKLGADFIRCAEWV